MSLDDLWADATALSREKGLMFVGVFYTLTRTSAWAWEALAQDRQGHSASIGTNGDTPHEALRRLIDRLEGSGLTRAGGSAIVNDTSGLG